VTTQHTPRAVLVTGTSQGIGEAIARTFLQNGDIVIGCAFSSLENAASARQMLETFSGRYHYFSVDVTQTSAIKQFVIDAEKLYGRIIWI